MQIITGHFVVVVVVPIPALDRFVELITSVATVKLRVIVVPVRTAVVADLGPHCRERKFTRDHKICLSVAVVRGRR
jgi:hypothetical protein